VNFAHAPQVVPGNRWQHLAEIPEIEAIGIDLRAQRFRENLLAVNSRSPSFRFVLAISLRTNGILFADGFMREIAAVIDARTAASVMVASMMGAGIFTTSGFIARDRLSNAVRKR
jgi:hypothetical protein